MRRSTWVTMLIGITVVTSLLQILRGYEEPPVSAKIVSVQRGDVHQTIPLTGHIAYTDEHFAYAGMSGRIQRICVQPGDRLAANEALLRLDASTHERMMDAMMASVQSMDHLPDVVGLPELQAETQGSVVRTERPCTVRQLLVEENHLVAAGTPVARLTSHQQEIVCQTALVDADRIEPGMWAWITVDGEKRAYAAVETIGETKVNQLTGLASRTVTLSPDQHIDLPEGSLVDVDVYLSGSDDVLSLPLEAITERNTVWWIHDGRCTEIPAQIVMTDEMRAWVDLPEGIEVAIGEFIQGQRIVEAET